MEFNQTYQSYANMESPKDLLFINDINKSLENIFAKLFADDTNCLISGNDFNQLERLVEVELNKLKTGQMQINLL